MPVDLRNTHKKKLPMERLNTFSEAVLKELKLTKKQVNLAFVSNAEIHKLNKQYLKHDYPTDVLAFPMKESVKGLEYPVLGDVIVSIDMAETHAEKFKTSFDRELELYIVHGILHLIGYKDEPENEKALMQEKEQEELKKVRARGH